MSVQPNHAPAALHSWRERRYPPPHPDEKVQKMREAQHGKAGDLPLPGPPIAAALDQLDQDGYAVIEDFWSPEQIAQLRLDLADVPSFTPPLGAKGGRGGSSNMIGKTRCLDGLLVDDRIMELCECHLGVAFELSICVLMNIYPGEKPQGLHQDDGIWESLAPRPHRPWVLNFLLAVDDFDDINGGTYIIPGSHKWADDDPRRLRLSTKMDECIQVNMKSGSLFTWTGSLFHAGGGNITDDRRVRLAINPNFHVSFLRQQENQFLGIPREVVNDMSPKLREIVGYNSWNLLGKVDGRTPNDILDADGDFDNPANPAAKPDPWQHGPRPAVAEAEEAKAGSLGSSKL